MRERLLPALALSLVWVGVATPVSGQTLAQRIEAVKKKRALEQAGQTVESPKVKMLQALLYTELAVDFNETPAREVFEYLKTALDINLIVRYSDDPIGHGIDAETPISLSAEKMRAFEVLDLVLEQCATVEACTWQLRGSFVEVGTKERLSAQTAREIRAYSIDDLLFEAPRFTDSMSLRLDDAFYSPWYGGSFGGNFGGNFGGYGSGGYGGSINPLATRPTGAEEREQKAQALIELIVEVVEPTAWARNGGQWATIRYREGALIVRAPDYIQRQINGYPRVPRPPQPEAKPAADAPAKP